MGSRVQGKMPGTGDRRLTLEERLVVHDIQCCEAYIEQYSDNKERQQFWVRRVDDLNQRLKQMDIAMRLVEPPLVPSLHVGPVTSKELDELYFERVVVFEASKKVPQWLKDLLYDKLSEQFGPSFDIMVKNLGINIWLKIAMPCNEYNPKALPEEDIVKAFVNKFALAANPVTSSAEDVIAELVRKIALAFPDVAPTESAMAVRVHNIALVD